MSSEVLSQSKIHAKFRQVNQKIDEVHSMIDSNNDKNAREG